MKEYIEREADLTAVSTITMYKGGVSFETAKYRLETIPAADVKPVVLCRDCKYAPSGTDDGEDQGFGLEWPHDEWPEDNPCPCKCADGWYSHKPKPDFFCAAGEKREES